MKKIIYVMSTFLLVCFVAVISVNASSRYLYINNVSIPTGNGYTTSALTKTEPGAQYIINKVEKSFYAYLYVYDTNGTGPNWNETRYTISANESGIFLPDTRAMIDKPCFCLTCLDLKT